MLSAEEVKARATSPLAALEVSIEEWTRRASLDNVREAPWGAGRCGLCSFYGPSTSGCDDNNNGRCPLYAKGREKLEHGCCAEYSTAKTAWSAHINGQATAAEVRAAFWAMVARLEKEKANLLAKEAETKKAEPKLKIRHGDFGICTFPISPPAPRLFIRHDEKIVAISRRGGVMHSGMNESPPDYTILGNIFDLMTEAMKGKKEYKTESHTVWLDGDGCFRLCGCCYSPAEFDMIFPGIFSLYIQHKLPEAKKC